MCGIAGKYNLNEEPVSEELIQTMCDQMAYRGPDDSGVFVDKNIGLGHRRLSILDLSPLGHQPMSTPDKKIWITFNGEIYNFKQLKAELTQKGYTFRSNSDTEVLLYLYREYGVDCLQHLRGMFAFAIWDVDKQRLFLARDRIGKKPLYYYFGEGKAFLFASEIKAILQEPKFHKEINYQALCDYFKYHYVPDPKTIYKNIYKLEPGYFLLCDKSGIQKQAYWDISFAKQHTGSTEDLSGQLFDILQESVELRMISDVPLGAFLSGGIDSSGVVALMSRVNDKPVTTCSIGFNSEAFDEVQYARKIADQFRTQHHEYTVKQDIAAILPKLVRHFDEPFADSSAVPTFYVSKLARQAVTVALAGDGGDENFVGYEKYTLDEIENNFRQKVPQFFRKSLFPCLSGMLRNYHNPLWQKGRSLLDTLAHDADYGFYLTNTEMRDSLWNALTLDSTKRAIGDYDPFSVTANYYHKADTDDHLAKILYTDLKSYLPGDILVKVDRMSMANSLEVRAPILDHNVIEFAAAVPSGLKYKRGDKKHILKQTFHQILPDEILYRKKMGFSVPLKDWLHGEIRQFSHDHLFSSNSGIESIFDLKKLREIWELHQSGKRNFGAVLWSCLMFELWHKEFMN